MKRNQVYSDIKETFGIVPTFLKNLPDATLEMEWQLMKRIEFEESPIPPKYRELIGLGIAATTKCPYCTLFHTEAARVFGATDKEIEDAVHVAKNSAGWSTYLNGLQVDLNEFRDEVRQMTEFVRERELQHA